MHVYYELLVTSILILVLFPYSAKIRHSPTYFPQIKKVKVTGKNKKGKKLSKTLKCAVTVKNPSVTLDRTTAELKVGEKVTVKANTSPKSATVDYTSSNSAVASVTDGVITGVAEGTANITATATCGTKKLKAVVKVTVADSVAAKIESVTVKDAKTLEVKFNGKVKDTTKESFKVTRAATEVKMAEPKWSADNTSAVLASETALQAGTYTVAYGTMSGTVVVEAQKATKINIRTKKIPLGTTLGSDQKVYYEVVDQYGADMGITSNKLTVTATNMTRNHTLNVGTSADYKNYFTVTNQLSSNDAIGDKIAVVAYLKNDVSILAKEELEIANIYTSEFKFGTTDSGDKDDKNIYVDKGDYKYSLSYTATDTEGNPVYLTSTGKNTLGQVVATNAPASSNNITFVSSNTSTIDPKDFKIDKDGKITFKTGSYDSKVTLTAINDVTGAVDKIEITVGKTSEITSMEIDEQRIPRQENSATVKAGIIAKDQYGKVMAADKIANTNLLDKFNVAASNGLKVATAKITADGKQVEITGLDTRSLIDGDSVSIKFSKKDGVDAGKDSTATVDIGPRRMPEKVECEDVGTLYASGKTGTLKVKVLDNYGENYTKAVLSGMTVVSDKVCVAVGSRPGDVSRTGQAEYMLTPGAVSGDNDSEEATISINLARFMTDEDTLTGELDTKTVKVPVSKRADGLDVGLVDITKTSYVSGEKVKVKITAKNGTKTLSKFAGKVAAKEVQKNAGSVAVSTKNITLEFKGGSAEAEFEVKAGAKTIEYTIATDSNMIDSGSATGYVSLTAAAEVPGTATKYAVAKTTNTSVATSGAITVTAQNDAGDRVTSYIGTKSVKVTVVNADGVDVTSTITTLSSGTAQITFTNGMATLNLDGIVNDQTYSIKVEATDGSGLKFDGKVTL